MPKSRNHHAPLTPDTRAAVVKELKEGQQMAAIARRYGLGRAVVRRLRDEAIPTKTTTGGPVLHVRVTADEAAAFDAICEREGVSRSFKLRSLMRQEAGFTSLDEPALTEIEAGRRELLAIGRNLNQITRAANSGKTILGPRELAQVQAMFREIQSFMNGLNGVLAEARRRPRRAA